MYTLARTQDGKVYGWGQQINDDGYNDDTLVPREVPGLSAVEIACGGSHCMAVANDGKVLVWENSVGNLEISGLLLPPMLSKTQNAKADELTTLRLRADSMCTERDSKKAELARLRGGNVENMSMQELEVLHDEQKEASRRVMEKKLQRQAEERVATKNKSFVCPISFDLMKDPVVASDGFTYERGKIEEWIQRHDSPGNSRLPFHPSLARSPTTNALLPNPTLTPNRTLKSAIAEQIEATVKELCSDRNDAEVGVKRQRVAAGWGAWWKKLTHESHDEGKS
mmetsp:Transcript_98239/g.143827  ORF Transcript_98239/g.143827 Transcript_98239/m.143827 type:complete len:282 (-) Transcript_98239:446-1291(-)